MAGFFSGYIDTSTGGEDKWKDSFWTYWAITMVDRNKKKNSFFLPFFFPFSSRDCGYYRRGFKRGGFLEQSDSSLLQPSMNRPKHIHNPNSHQKSTVVISIFLSLQPSSVQPTIRYNTSVGKYIL
jgi:hypothetical protein